MKRNLLARYRQVLPNQGDSQNHKEVASWYDIAACSVNWLRFSIVADSIEWFRNIGRALRQGVPMLGPVYRHALLPVGAGQESAGDRLRIADLYGKAASSGFKRGSGQIDFVWTFPKKVDTVKSKLLIS